MYYGMYNSDVIIISSSCISISIIISMAIIQNVWLL